MCFNKGHMRRKMFGKVTTDPRVIKNFNGTARRTKPLRLIKARAARRINVAGMKP